MCQVKIHTGKKTIKKDVLKASFQAMKHKFCSNDLSILFA